MLHRLATLFAISLIFFIGVVAQDTICGTTVDQLTVDRTASQYCTLTNNNATCAPEFTNYAAKFTYSNNPPLTSSSTPLRITNMSPQPMTVVIYKNQKPIGKIPYFVRVDRFSLLEIVGSNSTQLFDPYFDDTVYTVEKKTELESVEIAVEFLGFSTPRLKRARLIDENDLSLANRWVALYYTVVVKMDKGVVTGIDWENTCLGCSLEDCYEKEDTCGTRFNKCSRAPTTNEPAPDLTDISCSVKIYVAWSGTDVDKDYCLSGQQTIGNFRRFSARFAFDKAAATANQVIDGIKEGQYPEPGSDVNN